MENNNQIKIQIRNAIKGSSRGWLSMMTILLLSACHDYLDIEPLESVSDELAIVDEGSLNTALRGAYRSLGSGGYYGGNYVLL